MATVLSLADGTVGYREVDPQRVRTAMSNNGSRLT
jgi:hypothetical protein